jgi:transcriptional regulator with XRE-family HTH domain
MGKDLLTLKVLRQRLGFTQEELAAAIPRCSQPDVSMWEAGAPIPAEKARAILNLFRKSKIAGSYTQYIADPGLTVEDLSKPWDEVLLRLNGVQAAS